MAEATETQAPATRQVIQRASAKPQSAGDKVTVYCKMPNGLRLRVFRMVEQREPVLGGGTREFHMAEPEGPEVVVWGNRFRLGDPMTHRIIGDYGLTEGVDKDFWDAWLEANKEQPYVVNGLIFAAGKREYGEAEAEDRRDTWSGLGPLLKDDDPRAPRASANLTGVKDYESA